MKHKEKIKEAMDLIDKEINWCKTKPPEFNYTDTYQKAFIDGLEKAKYLIRKLIFIES